MVRAGAAGGAGRGCRRLAPDGWPGCPRVADLTQLAASGCPRAGVPCAVAGQLVVRPHRGPAGEYRPTRTDAGSDAAWRAGLRTGGSPRRSCRPGGRGGLPGRSPAPGVAGWRHLCRHLCPGHHPDRPGHPGQLRPPGSAGRLPDRFGAGSVGGSTLRRLRPWPGLARVDPRDSPCPLGRGADLCGHRGGTSHHRADPEP